MVILVCSVLILPLWLSHPIGISRPIFYLPYFVVISIIFSFINLICTYVIRLQQLKNKEKELYTLKLKEQLTKAQLDALHAKVNPHFLYNSLNSIAGLAKTDGDKPQLHGCLTFQILQVFNPIIMKITWSLLVMNWKWWKLTLK